MRIFNIYACAWLANNEQSRRKKSQMTEKNVKKAQEKKPKVSQNGNDRDFCVGVECKERYGD